MRETRKITSTAPQYSFVSGISFAQVDAWYDHTRRDLKMDILYPEDKTRKYPCVVWICGGAWIRMDRSAHTPYLAQLARSGFVVASVEYRTSNEGCFPIQLQDVKAGIRYLRAQSERYNIDTEHFGTMGESAGGYLAAMAALADDPSYDVGAFTEFSSKVQAACPWYPVTDLTGFPYSSPVEAGGSMESLLLGKNVMLHREDAFAISPVSLATKEAPPFLIIHGNDDHTVPFAQGEALHDKLEAAGADVRLLVLEGADHADQAFFQEEIWQEIIGFFKEKL
ncbi:MAG: alpha/beta hydrolase [Bacteroidales bacterium]|nr:alpha/beta hydrolase [Bacteroidales bacterium]MCM1417138.1 alpha/beta hydrolase [bacterium]MCM1423973.1 alpha/beta hydrolase [bacterium]